MPDIVISEFMDEAVMHEAFAPHSVLYDPGLVDSPERLIDAVSSARALIVRNRTVVNESLLASASELRVVGRLGVGLDNIDVGACKKRGVLVYPAVGGPDISVAEYVITAALMLLRGAWFRNSEILAGSWPRTQSIGREGFGKRLGLLGLGATARETATRAAALGMAVSAYDPILDGDHLAWNHVERLSMDALFGRSDAISVHVPLTSYTRNLVDAAAFSKMRRGAVLINASRGGIVNELALVEALKEHRISGAALDVFENEPLTDQTAKRFSGIPNLILTPHIAGVTHESNLRISRMVADAVTRHLREVFPSSESDHAKRDGPRRSQ